MQEQPGKLFDGAMSSARIMRSIKVCYFGAEDLASEAAGFSNCQR